MKRKITFGIIVATLFLVFPLFLKAQEQENKVTEPSEVTVDRSFAAFQKVIADYVATQSVETGTFDVYDSQLQKTRKLMLEKICDDVQAEQNYSECAQFKDTETGELVDIGFNRQVIENQLAVSDIKIRRVNGVEQGK